MSHTPLRIDPLPPIPASLPGDPITGNTGGSSGGGQAGSSIQLSYYLYDHLGNTRMVFHTVLKVDEEDPTYVPEYLYTARPPQVIFDLLFSHPAALQSLADAPASSAFCALQAEKNSGVKFSPFVTVRCIADYYPYGKILREWLNCTGERYLTTQHERDIETGYDYRGARFYDADLGRFLSVDPLAAEYAGWSGYNYVLGNPIMFIDPNGKNAMLSIDKEAKTVTMKANFHWSPNSGSTMEQMTGKSNTYVSNTSWQEFIQDNWKGPHSVSIDGVEYSVSFEINIITHETHAAAAAAFLSDPSSNFLFASSTGSSNYGPKTRFLTLNTNQQINGDGKTFDHEVGHALGLGHNDYQSIDGTCSISSRKFGKRNVIGRDVSNVVMNAIMLSNQVEGNKTDILLQTDVQTNTFTVQNPNSTQAATMTVPLVNGEKE